MGALALAIDGLELPAVEKISREPGGRSVPGADRDAAVGAHAGRDDAGGVDPALSRSPGRRATMATLTVGEIERLIYPVSFYRHKARHVKATCRMLVERFGGQVPATMEELLTLPGVGRKTANLVLILSFKSSEQHLRRHPRPSHLESARLGARHARPKKPSRRSTARRPPAGGLYINLYLVTWGQNVLPPGLSAVRRMRAPAACPQVGVARDSPAVMTPPGSVSRRSSCCALCTTGMSVARRTARPGP